MSNYRTCRNYENLEKKIYPGVPPLGIPEILPAEFDDSKVKEFRGFNYALSASERASVGCHFFLDDYQFMRLWRSPDRYIETLKEFACVLSPDFSLYADWPKAVQIYNHYRKHWLARYLQDHGVKVIPTICWSDASSYKWCFDGEPTESPVAVSSVGCLADPHSKQLFLEGYAEMLRRLRPSRIIFYGTVPEECEGPIYAVDPFYRRLRGLS